MNEFIPTKTQQGLWLICQNPNTSKLYNNIVSFKIIGKLNIEALRLAFDKLLVCHSALTSNFYFQKGQCVCVNRKYTNLLKITSHNNDKSKKRPQNKHDNHLFDLENKPFIRAELHKTNKDSFILTLITHHLAADAWSVGLIIKNLTIFYDSLYHGNKIKLTNDGYIPYLQLIKSECKSKIDFWHNYLKDCPYKHDIPQPEKSTVQKGFAHAFLKLPKRDADLIKKICKIENITPFIVLETLTSLALGRESKCNDVVICSPSSGRLDYNTHSMVGNFMNLVCIRSKFNLNFSLKQLIRTNRQSILNALSNQDVAFEQVVKIRNPIRLKNKNPISQILFSHQNISESELALKHCTVSKISHNKNETPFDLSIDMTQKKSIYELSFIWNKAFISEHSVKNIKKYIIMQLGQLSLEFSSPE